jgi:predicted dinucleotide-binding enzyme
MAIPHLLNGMQLKRVFNWEHLQKQPAFGEIILNVTQGDNSINALTMAGSKNLDGKIMVDIANPLDFSKGMPASLIPELSNTNSLGEEIQKTFPGCQSR